MSAIDQQEERRCKEIMLNLIRRLRNPTFALDYKIDPKEIIKQLTETRHIWPN
jgi:hypothetical protein